MNTGLNERSVFLSLFTTASLPYLTSLPRGGGVLSLILTAGKTTASSVLGSVVSSNDGQGCIKEKYTLAWSFRCDEEL